MSLKWQQTSASCRESFLREKKTSKKLEMNAAFFAMKHEQGVSGIKKWLI